jgi:hypothetical protein
MLLRTLLRLLEGHLRWLLGEFPYSCPSLDELGLTEFGYRIVPAANFATAEGRSALLGAMLSAFTTVGGAAQIMVTAPYSYNATSPSDVSVTPAWRNALWHTLLVGFWNYDSTADQQAAVYSTVSAAADKLRAITPGSGAYQNEADVSEPDHESECLVFWSRCNTY